MSLLNFALGRKDARLVRRDRNRPKFGLEALEERKVLSTTSGTFEGMAWVYTYDQTAKTGNMVIADKPGTDTIHIQGQIYAGQEGDSGFDPKLVGKVVGINLVNNDDEGGPSIVPGTAVSIVVNHKAGDESFVNDEKSFNFSYNGTVNAPVDQSGSAFGMAWTYHYNNASNSWAVTINDVKGSGTINLARTNNTLMFGTSAGPVLQSGATGSITLNRKVGDYAITNNSGFTMNTVTPVDQSGVSNGLAWTYHKNTTTNSWSLTITDKVGTGSAYLNMSSGILMVGSQNGPLIQPGASGAIHVVKGQRDLNIVNGTSFPVDIVARHTITNGNVQTKEGSLGWSFDYNELTNSGVITFTALPGSGVINLNLTHLDLSPGDPGYDPHHNPITGVDADEQGTNFSGGPSFYHAGLPDPSISIVVKRRAGDVTFKNNTSYGLTYQVR